MQQTFAPKMVMPWRQAILNQPEEAPTDLLEKLWVTLKDTKLNLGSVLSFDQVVIRIAIAKNNNCIQVLWPLLLLLVRKIPDSILCSDCVDYL